MNPLKSVVAPKTQYTPEDLLAMPDGDSYELVNGRLVERPTGALSSWVGGVVYSHLSNCCHRNKGGWAWPADNSYRCFPKFPNTVRKPDVSFIRLGRLPGEELPEGHVPIAPDLAVEVISPNDPVYEVDEKVEEYLQAGVRLVWEINPKTRIVLVHRADGSVSKLRETEELTGEDVVPGFRCLVRDLFPPASVNGTRAEQPV